MKIQVLYDQGSARIPEDGMIFKPPHYFGVTDGVSEVYLPREGPRLFTGSGRTGGQLASHILSQSFGDANPGESFLEDILRRANRVIRALSESYGLSLQETELLPAAAFVVASIDNQNVNILQAGDSLAVWEMKDGTIAGTPNRAFRYEENLLYVVAKLMEKHNEDRQKMWEEFRPYLMAQRRANINTERGGFALLNGQSEAELFWQKFTFQREEITLLILFSDGFVPFEWTRDERTMGKMVVNLYRTGGLHQVLTATRAVAEEKKSSSHEDYPEATAVAIEL